MWKKIQIFLINLFPKIQKEVQSNNRPVENQSANWHEEHLAQTSLLARNSVLFMKEARRPVPFNEKKKGLQQTGDNSEQKCHKIVANYSPHAMWHKPSETLPRLMNHLALDYRTDDAKSDSITSPEILTKGQVQNITQMHRQKPSENSLKVFLTSESRRQKRRWIDWSEDKHTEMAVSSHLLQKADAEGCVAWDGQKEKQILRTQQGTI